MNPLSPVTQSTRLPANSAQPLNAAVVAVDGNASQFSDASKQHRPITYVYRGELIDGLSNDKRYRPSPHLIVDPANLRAIASYQKVVNDPPLTGQLLDGYI